MPLSWSSLQAAANTGFAFSANSPPSQREVERAAEEEEEVWCMPFSRNDISRNDSMKFPLGCPTKKRKYSDTLDNPQSSSFEVDRSPTKKSNSNFAPFSALAFGSHFSSVPLPDSSESQDDVCLDITDDSSEFAPPSGLDLPSARYDWRFSEAEPVYQSGRYLPAVDLSVSRAFSSRQSLVPESFTQQPAEGWPANSFR